MPARYSMARRGGRRPNRLGSVIDSMKNFVAVDGSLSGTLLTTVIAEAQDSAGLAVAADVERGCKIFRIWYEIDVCGLAGTGVQNNFDGYFFKNPGQNLTPPAANNYGVSNEKKFIFKSMHAMIMRNQDGNDVIRFRGWLKIPRVYQRMGSNDQINFQSVCTAAVTGHISMRFIYKWYK